MARLPVGTNPETRGRGPSAAEANKYRQAENQRHVTARYVAKS